LRGLDGSVVWWPQSQDETHLTMIGLYQHWLPKDVLPWSVLAGQGVQPSGGRINELDSITTII